MIRCTGRQAGPVRAMAAPAKLHKSAAPWRPSTAELARLRALLDRVPDNEAETGAGRAGAARAPNVSPVLSGQPLHRWRTAQAAVVRQVWCDSLLTWVAALATQAVPPDLTPEALRTEACRSQSQWLTGRVFPALFVVLFQAAMLLPQATRVLREVAALRGMLLEWLCSPDARARTAAHPFLCFLFHVTGWCYAEGLTRLQIRAGRRHAVRAQRRAGAWPPAVVQALWHADAAAAIQPV